MNNSNSEETPLKTSVTLLGAGVLNSVFKSKMFWQQQWLRLSPPRHT